MEDEWSEGKTQEEDLKSWRRMEMWKKGKAAMNIIWYEKYQWQRSSKGKVNIDEYRMKISAWREMGNARINQRRRRRKEKDEEGEKEEEMERQSEENQSGGGAWR